MNAIVPIAKSTKERLDHLGKQLEDYKVILVE
jgi:hypothetical protein